MQLFVHSPYVIILVKAQSLTTVFSNKERAEGLPYRVQLVIEKKNQINNVEPKNLQKETRQIEE